MINQKLWNRLERPLGLCLLAHTACSLAASEPSHHSPALTGTNLHNNITPAGLTVYTRGQILKSGESNAADFIRNLPINSFGSLRPQSGSSMQGDATVSLRGLGAARSLILIDGRRMPKSASNPSAQNLSLIPMGAIERIEILPTGASAVYGADAIGGVVNIITRSDFQGLEIMLGGAEVSTPKSGGEREEGSVVFGVSSEQSSLVAGVSWNDREIIYARDVPWRRLGASVYGNSFTTISYGDTFPGFEPLGFDNFDWASFVGACDYPNTAYFTTSNPDSLNGTRCAYDFTADFAEEPATENKAFYIKAKHSINDDWEVWANSSLSQAESFGRYAPAPDSSYFSTPLTASSPNNPTNPESPLFDSSLGLEPQAVNWWHRFAPLGNRDTQVTSQLFDTSLGLNGQIGAVKLKFVVRHSHNSMTEIKRNFLLNSSANALIEDGSYSLLNPFTTPQNVLNAMKVNLLREARYDQDEVLGGLSFNLNELPGGVASFHLGFEHRTEKYSDQYDPQTESGQVRNVTGQSGFGKRDVSAALIETWWPLLQNFDLILAGRYENYSDSGESFSIQSSSQYQFNDQLKIRASWNQSTRVPDLKESNSLEFGTRCYAINPVSLFPECDSEALIYAALIDEQIINSKLGEENTSEYQLGLQYQPWEWLSLGLDYYDFHLSDRIRYINGLTLRIMSERGLNLPEGLGCDRFDGIYDPDLPPISCQSGLGNSGSIKTNGATLDVKINYALKQGQMIHKFNLNHTHEFKIDGGTNQIGKLGYPANRAQWLNSFGADGWQIIHTMNVIDNHKSNITNQNPIPTWVTHDFQFDKFTQWNSTFTLGIKNINEKLPSSENEFNGVFLYNSNLYNGFGRIIYARFTQTF